MSGKGKVVLLVLSLLCLSLALPDLEVAAAEGEGGAKAQAPVTVAPVAPAPVVKGPVSAKGKQTRAFSFLKRERKGQEPREEWGFSALKVGGTTILVLLLAGVAIFFLSKIQRGRLRGGTRRNLEVLETLRLGARKRLHMAQLAHRTVILAETDKGISLLLALEEDEVPAVAETEGEPVAATPGPTAEAPRPELLFSRILRRRAGGENR